MTDDLREQPGDVCGDRHPPISGMRPLSCQLPIGHRAHRSGGTAWQCLCEETRQRLDQAEAAIERVRALHVRNANTGDCEHCSEHDYPDYSVPSPCPTITALDQPKERT